MNHELQNTPTDNPVPPTTTTAHQLSALDLLKEAEQQSLTGSLKGVDSTLGQLKDIYTSDPSGHQGLNIRQVSKDETLFSYLDDKGQLVLDRMSSDGAGGEIFEHLADDPKSYFGVHDNADHSSTVSDFGDGRKIVTVRVGDNFSSVHTGELPEQNFTDVMMNGVETIKPAAAQ